MGSSSETCYDEIGPWSEVKLAIVREFASAYSQILARKPFYHVYIDGFSSSGLCRSRDTGELVPGSALNALQLTPPFCEYHLIDIDELKVESLERIAQERNDVTIYSGDCNKILRDRVLPAVRYDNYRRGLCLLDPYGLHLEWSVIALAGKLQTIDLFVNFPTLDINRNVLHRRGVNESQAHRLDALWGDSSWRDVAYESRSGLFGPIEVKVPSDILANAFAERLSSVAGFRFVLPPLPIVNTKGGLLYHLVFAAPVRVATHIVEDIFRKYRRYSSYCG